MSIWRAVRLYRDNTNPDDPSELDAGQLESPLQRDGIIEDPTRGIRIQALNVDAANNVATVKITLGASPIPFEQRFRAVNTWATNNGFIGAYPNFHQADYGPGWTFPSLMLSSAVCEWLDVPENELVDVSTIEARFRSLQTYARNAGTPGVTFVGAFPTGMEAVYGGTRVFGSVLIRAEHAIWMDIAVNNLSDVSSSEKLFQSVNQYAHNNDYVGGFPTFYNAVRNGTSFYGAVLLKNPPIVPGLPPLIPIEQLHGSDIGEFFDLQDRLGSVNRYAAKLGFVSGLPTFIDRDFGRGTHFGTILFTAGQAEWHDIPASELGPVPTPDERFRAVARWAAGHGYVGGFPNFFQAIYNGVEVYGAILFKGPAAEWRDLPSAQLPSYNDPAQWVTSVSDFAVKTGFFSGFPNYYFDSVQGLVGSVMINQGYATWRDIPISQLVFAG